MSNKTVKTMEQERAEYGVRLFEMIGQMVLESAARSVDHRSKPVEGKPQYKWVNGARVKVK